MENLTTCGYCQEIFNNPITLSCCGETICKKDLDDLYIDPERKDSIRCPFDDKILFIPYESIMVNKVIKKMLEIDLSDDHARAKKQIGLFVDKINDYEQLVANPEDYIYEYFTDVQNKIDLKIEIIKDEIINYHEEMTNKISNLKDECSKKSREYSLTADNNYKQEAITLTKQVKQFTLDNQKWIEMNKDIENKTNKAGKVINEIKSKLIDYNEIKLEETHLNARDVIGQLKINKKEKEDELKSIAACDPFGQLQNSRPFSFKLPR